MFGMETSLQIKYGLLEVAEPLGRYVGTLFLNGAGQSRRIESVGKVFELDAASQWSHTYS